MYNQYILLYLHYPVPIIFPLSSNIRNKLRIGHAKYLSKQPLWILQQSTDPLQIALLNIADTPVPVLIFSCMVVKAGPAPTPTINPLTFPMMGGHPLFLFRRAKANPHKVRHWSSLVIPLHHCLVLLSLSLVEMADYTFLQSEFPDNVSIQLLSKDVPSVSSVLIHKNNAGILSAAEIFEYLSHQTRSR